MIDASVDSDFAALERADSLKLSATPARLRVRRGVLSTLPAYPPGYGKSTTEQGVLLVETLSPESAGPDPLGHLQTARLGFAAAVVLVLCWLWIRQRRKAF